MAKPELGTKRVCPVTGRKFFDLNKDPIISPYTGQVVPVVTAGAVARARPEPKDTRPDAGAELVAEEAGDVELVSLEEADEDEAATGKKAPAADEDLEIEDELPDSSEEDADTFLEEDEDEGSDVSDLIDPDIVNDEET